MSTQRVTAITKAGYEKLKAELKRLKEVERPKNIQEIADARAHGDLSENAEYDAAKEAQWKLNQRIALLETALSTAEIVDPSKFSGDRVMFGATVVIYDEDADKELEYQLVSELEADLGNGKLSITSPLGRALIGKYEDDDVIVKTPAGTRHMTVVSVEYK